MGGTPNSRPVRRQKAKTYIKNTSCEMKRMHENVLSGLLVLRAFWARHPHPHTHIRASATTIAKTPAHGGVTTQPECHVEGTSWTPSQQAERANSNHRGISDSNGRGVAPMGTSWTPSQRPERANHNHSNGRCCTHTQHHCFRRKYTYKIIIG